MKKSLLFVFVFISSLLSAQQKAVITLTDGTQQTLPVWKIDNISFLDFQKPKTAIPEAVDLGLRSGMLWAPWNLGAESESEVGFLLGWGNPDSTNLSTELKYFPTPTATRNITNTDNDVAKDYWGGLWHMPTAEDFRELLTLHWEWDADAKAYKISNPEAEDETVRNNYIYLPVTGQRYGEAEPDSLELGFYWSGDIAVNDSASYLRLPEYAQGEEEQEVEQPLDMSLFQLLAGNRARHFAVRPVYGEYVIPITVRADEAEVNNLSATIMVHVEGMGQNVQYYLIYSKAPEVAESTASKSAIYTIAELNDRFAERITLENLEYNTKYYYRLVARIGNDIIVEEADHEFQTEPDTRIVDLGLSVKWASMNVGATSPEEAGYYVQWGAIDENGVQYNGSGNISSDKEHDIATYQWGDQWRMPTTEEFEELYKYCKATYEIINGKAGIRFSRNNNSIFLPLTGGRVSSTVEQLNEAGYYWTSESSPYVANYLFLMPSIYKDFFKINTIQKTLGVCVRPVYGPNDKNNFIVDPDNPDEPGDTPGDDPGQEQGGEDNPEPPVNPVAEDVVAIDLGLTSGTLWANMNVGAKNSGEAGSYYAWGELETKETYYLTNYSLYDSTNDRFIFEGGGRKGIQGLDAYDAAHVEWGGNWVMPSPVQFEELMNECTWEWGIENNQEGYIVKSTKNNNHIFLPITGYYDGANCTARTRGFYWTSSLYLFPSNDYWKHAQEFVITNTDVEKNKYYITDNPRQSGLVIRPVKVKKTTTSSLKPIKL